LELAPGYSRGWLIYGDVLCKLKRFDESLRALRNAESDPDISWLAFGRMGSLYSEKGETKQAIAAFRKSIDLKPKAYTFNFLGVELTGIGRRPEAIDCYTAALELEPENEEAHYNLGCEYRF